MQPTEKLVRVQSVVAEIEFQKNRMIEYLQSWSVKEDTIEAAADYFNIAIHGVEDHLEHYEM